MNESSAELSNQVVNTLIEKGLTIATAESLTGGLLCATLIDTAGASNCVRGGACTYATDTKASVLQVDAQHLETHGPVDPDTAIMMAEGAADLYQANWGVSTTGVAGPGPADGHDAGTVYIGWCDRRSRDSRAWRFHFHADRPTVRRQSVDHAMRILLGMLAQSDVYGQNRVR